MRTRNDVRCPHCNHMLYRDVKGEKTEVINTEKYPKAYFEKDVKCTNCGRKYGLILNKQILVA